MVPGPKNDSKSWKEMEDGEEKRTAFMREMEPFLREMQLRRRPAPPSRVARKRSVVVAKRISTPTLTGSSPGLRD